MITVCIMLLGLALIALTVSVYVYKKTFDNMKYLETLPDVKKLLEDLEYEQEKTKSINQRIFDHLVWWNSNYDVKQYYNGVTFTVIDNINTDTNDNNG